MADTALRTADSGYLTRRLVDVAQDLIVRDNDCDVLKFNIPREFEKMRLTQEAAFLASKPKLLGRILASDAVSIKTGEVVLPAGTALDDAAFAQLMDEQVPEIFLNGESGMETVALTVPKEQLRANLRDLMLREMLSRKLEETVTNSAGESILTAGTQIEEADVETLLNAELDSEILVRRNNVKGIDVEAIVEELMKEPLVRIVSLKTADQRHRAVGQITAEPIVDARTKQTLVAAGEMVTTDAVQALIGEQEELRVLNTDLVGRKSAELILNDQGDSLLRAGELLDETNKHHISQLWKLRGNAGIVNLCSNVIENLRDRIVGRIAAEDIMDPKTGEILVKINDEISEDIVDRVAAVRAKVLIRSVLTCKSRHGVCVKCYARNLATGRIVDVGEAVGIIAAQSIGEPGTQLTMRTFHTGGVASTGGQASSGDITSGLPRVEELFEARKPKHPAVLAEIDGRVELREAKGARKATITSPSGEERIYPILYGSRLLVRDGQNVEPGDRLTDGPLNPHDILRIKGLRETHRYIVSEVQKVYKEQGVEINDKHIEVMVRQMLHKVKVEEPGDTDFSAGRVHGYQHI